MYAIRSYYAKTFMPALANPILTELNDSALLNFQDVRLAMSTDSYVVDPIFFPGGDIGSLAVHGTVNDLAMRGAQPCYLSVGFILEEDLEITDLEKLLTSMAEAAREAGVQVVAADTKVVERGKADRIVITSYSIHYTKLYEIWGTSAPEFRRLISGRRRGPDRDPRGCRPGSRGRPRCAPCRA